MNYRVDIEDNLFRSEIQIVLNSDHHLENDPRITIVKNYDEVIWKLRLQIRFFFQKNIDILKMIV